LWPNTAYVLLDSNSTMEEHHIKTCENVMQKITASQHIVQDLKQVTNDVAISVFGRNCKMWLFLAHMLSLSRKITSTHMVIIVADNREDAIYRFIHSKIELTYNLMEMLSGSCDNRLRNKYKDFDEFRVNYMRVTHDDYNTLKEIKKYMIDNKNIVREYLLNVNKETYICEELICNRVYKCESHTWKTI
jgi:hypothetical protein